MTKQDVKRCLKLCRKKQGTEVNKLSSTEMKYIQKIRKFGNEIYVATPSKTYSHEHSGGEEYKEILRELPISESVVSLGTTPDGQSIHTLHSVGICERRRDIIGFVVLIGRE